MTHIHHEFRDTSLYVLTQLMCQIFNMMCSVIYHSDFKKQLDKKCGLGAPLKATDTGSYITGGHM
jgi:hypothetical protein